MEKSLYRFSTARPVTNDAKRWLAIHLANCAGMDKLALDERVAWVEQNHSLITAIAKDPIDNLHELEAFDSPWCGLAACEEYYHCVITGDRQTTSLPVACDASCSGIQHLSAMTLCADSGALVNLLPADKPQDAYMAVLNRTIELLQDDNPELAQWATEVGRPLAKRVTMTVPYAATAHSNRGYIRTAILEHEYSSGRNRKPTGEELTTITRAMLCAMREVVPGPIEVMQWIKASVKQFFISHPDGELNWMSPSGFPVHQDKRKPNIIRVRTKLLGDVISSRVGDGFKEVAVNKHCSSAAPNFIHAADSALLHNSFKAFQQPFFLIHDSILTSATDMEYMSKVIREEFIEIYKQFPLMAFAEVLGVSPPTHLMKNTLDLDQIGNSCYFFS